MVVHFRPTVGAEHQTRQGIGFPGGVRASDSLPDFLHPFPCGLVDDGLMGVLENQPVLRGIVHPLILVGFLGGSEIHRMPQILRLGEHDSHGVPVPVVGPGHIHIVFVGAAASDGKIVRGAFHLIFGQNLRNFVLPIAFQC